MSRIPCCLRRSLRCRREATLTLWRGGGSVPWNVRRRTLLVLPCHAVTSVTSRSTRRSSPAGRRCFGGGKSFLRLRPISGKQGDYVRNHREGNCNNVEHPQPIRNRPVRLDQKLAIASVVRCRCRFRDAWGL